MGLDAANGGNPDRAADPFVCAANARFPAILSKNKVLLTGYRSGEIKTLRWADYRDGHIFLRDSKTGPDTGWLSAAARAVLDALPRTSPWVFPSARGDNAMSGNTLSSAWGKVRTEAGLKDVRLHDLRHYLR